MSLLKQFAIIALLVALAGGGYWGWQHLEARAASAEPSSGGSGRGRQPPRVDTTPAAMRAVESVVEAVGTTRARRAVEITPLAPGRVVEITFQPGASVAAGDVLLRLDDDIQRADLLEAQARLTEARSALTRAQSLRRSRAVSDDSVEKLVAALATAEASSQRAARRLRDRTVTAPFAGIVGLTRVELGARVEEGDTVTTLDDLSVVEIEFSLPEVLFGRIGTGQRILADAAAFPGRAFEGRIESIDSRIDPLSRAFKARAVVANPDLTLPAGMFMHLSVVLETRQALTVPEEAIVVDASQAYVFVVTGNGDELRARRRDVTVGQRSFGHVEIRAGVEPGEDVVVRGVQRVRDGAPVRRAEGGGGRSASG
ncbi:MAG: efflux RND transporter periplasmic adaptor subunit [Ectothiorhodospiraceae bacterium]|nr:efflux RND transporter periplasmic adaptor subunit [Ectothiorhodospiraceae bacterium]